MPEDQKKMHKSYKVSGYSVINIRRKGSVSIQEWIKEKVLQKQNNYSWQWTLANEENNQHNYSYNR